MILKRVHGKFNRAGERVCQRIIEVQFYSYQCWLISGTSLTLLRNYKAFLGVSAKVFSEEFGGGTIDSVAKILQ